MSNLERRYRALLKVLPRWYRQDREEEMVGIFLAERDDELDLEHSWPGWGEAGAILALSVRTNLAAGAGMSSVPVKVMWRGEVVRALGMLGLLLGLFYATAAVGNLVVAFGGPYPPDLQWWRVLELGPFVAFGALLSGRRTLAKVAAAGPVVVSVAEMTLPHNPALWALIQLPSFVTFACLCLGFHREAPTPPARRLWWWGAGAVVLGVLGGVATGVGLMSIGLITVVARVVAFVRGDAVLGRALSLFALLQLVPVVTFLFADAGLLVPAGGLGLVLLLVAVAPVRRRAQRVQA